jgi:glutathione peroxidase
MYTFFIAIISFFVTSIYSLEYTDIAGNTVSMGTCQNKKVLLVNIATAGPRTQQLAGLQQLQQHYGDSLIIIAFPSNSFGHEPKSNSEIKQFCQTNYAATFRIAQKKPVTGNNAQTIYKWLADKNENKAMMGTVNGDFTKFLIDKDGSLIGVFSPAVEPMDMLIQNAITGN